MPVNLPVFVYGTLRTGEVNAGVLDRWRLRTEPAWLPDHHLHVLEYPCVVPAGDHRAPDAPVPVVGELVWIRAGAHRAALERLDRFEGFVPDDRAGSLYTREHASARTGTGDDVRCWVYVAGNGLQARLHEGNRVGSGNWSAR